jgi:hypothetical protein
MESDIAEVYVVLLDEGTDVVRPTRAVSLGNDLCRLLATPNYDPDDEHWEFPPGSIVRCFPDVRSGDEVLVAENWHRENSGTEHPKATLLRSSIVREKATWISKGPRGMGFSLPLDLAEAF